MSNNEQKRVPSTAEIMDRIEKLEKENARLGIELTAKDKQVIALQAAVNESMAESADLTVIMGREIKAVPIGTKKVTVKRFVHKTKSYVDEEQTLDYFRYLIDLPPSGGMYITLGNNQYVHGDQYDLDVNTLRSVQEVVARSWLHEAQINGNNEAAWGRKKVNTTLSMKTGRVSHG